MALPYTIVAGQKINAAPVQGNFEDLDGRTSVLESQISFTQDNAALYGTGVFTGGLVANQVGTTLVYTAGSFVLNGVFYYKTTYVVDFVGYAANTYYVEVDSGTLVPSINLSKSSARVNLNTVVWNGTSFDSVTEADRTILYGFSQFVALPGRVGGQIVNGGSAASENLELRSTSHATKGFIRLGIDDSLVAVGSGLSTPTARLHVAAGSASRVPFKLTSGILRSAPEAGALEFLTDAIYFTITSGTARKTIAFLESPIFTTPTLGVATATLVTCPNIQGSVAASGNLELISTADTTKGVVKVKDAVIQNKLTSLSSGTLALTDVQNTIVCDCSSGSLIINLPDASTYLGIDYCMTVVDTITANVLTVNCNAGDTFDGSNNTATLALGSMLFIRAISADRWLVINESGVIFS